jgi:NAD(P)H-hydrate epimerase
MAATLARFEYVVDALLGTGIQGAVRGTAAAVIAAMNEATTPIIAIDLPSGIQADSGTVDGEAVRAMATVSLAALKSCHVLAPACEYCGDISVAEISLPATLLEAADARLLLTAPADVAAALPRRAAESHKGSFGRVLVVGGAPGTAGAAALAARGALRSGAGLVDVACPESVYEMIGAAVTEALVHPLPSADDGSLGVSAADLADLVEAASVVVIGPGLGTGAAAATMVRELVRGESPPVVVDADGLNALGDDLATVAESSGVRILTPHPGEAGRLLGCDTREVQADRPAAVRELADRSGAIVVLKGYRSLIAAPGRVTVVNPTGNPGMATGGTGDVLAGAIGALLGQGLEPFRAAWVGAWLHGAAGDAVAAEVGEISMTAGDLAAALPAAFLAIEEQG